jgi:hypothetical protein
MSIQSEITRLETAKSDIASAIGAKGVTVPSGTKLDGMASLIEDISAAADPVLQTKTVTPTTAVQNVTPDSGYDGLSKVTVNAMPTATQATPSISVSSAGLITASATQTAGYVSAGTKSATKQLTTQAAKTVTPTTSNQTAVASGRYTTGAITVKGDANLVAGNIKSGVSIFGVAGNYEGSGGGGGGSVETCTVTISADGPVQSSNVHYTNENMTVATEAMSSMDWMMGKTFTVAKGTLLATRTTAPSWNIDGNISLIIKSVSTSTPITLFSIEGTGTICAGM